jgi:hypothetical protein
MTTEIPYRIWYSPKEAAQLRCCSEDFVRKLIRNGRRKNPTGDFIPPHLVDHNGASLVVHRSWIFPSEPGPSVSPIVPTSTLTDEQIARVVRQTFLEMGLLAERRTAA